MEGLINAMVHIHTNLTEQKNKLGDNESKDGMQMWEKVIKWS